MNSTVSVLKVHLNIKNKRTPAILTQKNTSLRSMEKQLLCSHTCPHSHTSKIHWACKLTEIIHEITADTKKITMFKNRGEICCLAGKQKGYYDREATEGKTKIKPKQIAFLLLGPQKNKVNIPTNLK